MRNTPAALASALAGVQAGGFPEAEAGASGQDPDLNPNPNPNRNPISYEIQFLNSLRKLLRNGQACACPSWSAGGAALYEGWPPIWAVPLASVSGLTSSRSHPTCSDHLHDSFLSGSPLIREKASPSLIEACRWRICRQDLARALAGAQGS